MCQVYDYLRNAFVLLDDSQVDAAQAVLRTAIDTMPFSRTDLAAALAEDEALSRGTGEE